MGSEMDDDLSLIRLINGESFRGWVDRGSSDDCWLCIHEFRWDEKLQRYEEYCERMIPVLNILSIDNEY